MKEKKYLRAHGKIVLSDYREYAVFNLFRNRFSRVLRAATVLLILLLSLYFFIAGFQLRYPPLIVIGGILLLCLGSFFLLLRKKVKDVCVQRKPFLYATHEVCFGGNGLIYSVVFDGEHNPYHWEDTQDDYLYSGFLRVFENGGFYYFYPEKKTAIIVPKRNMTPADSIKLREVLQRELGKKFIRCI